MRLLTTMLASEYKPREKLSLFGVPALSDAELIATLLGTGDGQRNAATLASDILDNFGHCLASLTSHELKTLRGVGETKAARIVAAIELGKRIARGSNIRKPIEKSEDAFRLISSFALDQQTENVWIAALDAKNQPLHVSNIARGGRAACSLDPADVFRLPIKVGALSIILFHNHPSQDPQPSLEDDLLTARIRKAGFLLGIELVDHLVVSSQRYYSYREHKQL